MMGKRKINNRLIITIAVICFSFVVQHCFSQQLKTTVDKRSILIGEPIQYKVTATFPTGVYKVHWFLPADSAAHFELVDKSKIDTTADNNNTVMEQTITLTSFDSGRWNTPAFMVNFDPVKDDTTVNLFTDSIAVSVVYAPADTSNNLRDIKPIMEVEVKSYLWLYITIGVLLIIILLLVLRRMLKKDKFAPDPVYNSKLSPYDEAMQQLEKLKAFNLSREEEVKQYHIRLSEIFKWYISRRQQASAMNKTTGDVLVQLSENNLSKDDIAATATALRCGDAVKFAKFLPPVYESEQCLLAIKQTIDHINNSKTVNPQ
ncbi:hypothetical protein [Ferruginibacter sp.]